MKQTTAPDNHRATGHNHSSAAKQSTASRTAGPRLPEASREAKRIAASILEVLAGASSPTQAAATLDVSLPRYYLLEQRAIEALVAACEPRSGRTISPKREVDILRLQLERAQRDSARYQTLLRVAQRTIGLSPAPTQTASKGKGSAKLKRSRRPTARALVAARALRADESNHDAINDVTPSQPDDMPSSQTPATPCTV